MTSPQVLSLPTRQLLVEYEAMWRVVFDAVCDDLSTKDYGPDAEALELTALLVPRPKVFVFPDPATGV
jgi:hypothetical protein